VLLPGSGLIAVKVKKIKKVAKHRNGLIAKRQGLTGSAFLQFILMMISA
jgi:hypothetical protein